MCLAVTLFLQLDRRFVVYILLIQTGLLRENLSPRVRFLLFGNLPRAQKATKVLCTLHDEGRQWLAKNEN